MRYGPVKADVRKILRRRAREMAEETARMGRVVSPAALAELEALARVDALQAQSRGSARLLKGSVLCVLALVLVALYAWPMETTVVNAEVLASEVALELGSARNVLAGERLSELRVYGLDSMRLPTPGGNEATVGGTTLALRVDSAVAGRGTLDLAGTDFPAGTRVRIRPSPGGGRHAWEVLAPGGTPGALELMVVVSGPVRLSVEGRADARLSLSHGTQILLYPGADFRLETTFADTAARVLDPQPRARDLAFHRPHSLPRGVREVSSVVSGVVVMEQFRGREVKLAAGQALRFDSTDVDVYHLALEKGQVRVRFGGDVHGMSTGTYHTRDLMPSRLEHLAASRLVMVLGAVLIMLSGYALLVIDWLRAR